MRTFLFLALSYFMASCQSQTESPASQDRVIIPGAWRTDQYLSMLENKKVGLVINHSSRVGEKHLLDTLKSLGVDIPKVFTPEHGLEGTADAGEEVDSEQRSDLEVISLFGAKRKPAKGDLEGLDVILFDLQDVGVRFYTYISTMHYMMEASAREKIPFVVLDRPNPNGRYVDGPLLQEEYRSFVGLHPIPILHGMTVGELARMIVGEEWLNEGLKPELTIIEVQHWSHQNNYALPIRPSPNLPNDRSIRLYPSLCLFEGTIMSVGRGTEHPFQQIGHPAFPETGYTFVPRPMEGAQKPKHMGKTCHGIA
jgi:uncharacterized protein YbbC (DUF1343 family)